MTLPPAPAAPPAPPAGWRRLPPAARVGLAAVASLVALSLLPAGIDLVTGGPAPSGPPSSSYATAPDGLAAYADLLARFGHPVRRLRSTLDDAGLAPGATVVVADPSPLSGEENRALRRFVEGGGRLVAAGKGSVASLRRVMGQAPVWAPGGPRSARPLVPVPEVAGVSLVRSAGRGSWKEAGAGLPVLFAGGNGRADAAAATSSLATVASVGAGRVVALADASVLQNAFLARADNAVFAVAVAGEPERPVLFAEEAHGFGAGGGMGAIPREWRWALAGFAAATLVWMWSRGRRLGPPEEQERPAPPPRRAYVDAMAASLAKTRQPARSVQPLQAAARRRLARRAGLPPDAGDDALRRAAEPLGVAPEDVAALLAPPRDDSELLEVGRAAVAVGGLAEPERTGR